MKWDQRYVTEKLRDAVNEKITQMYGQNVPEEPQERLCHEIDSIEKKWVGMALLFRSFISREGKKRWQYSVEPRNSRGILCGISLGYHRGKSVVGTLRGI